MGLGAWGPSGGALQPFLDQAGFFLEEAVSSLKHEGHKYGMI